MKHLLIISQGLFESPNNVNSTKAKILSRYYTGDIIHVVHKKEYKKYDMGGLILRGCYIPQLIRYNKLLSSLYFYLHTTCATVYRHYRKEKYSIIIGRNPLAAGLMARWLSTLIKTKYIVEFNGAYHRQIVWDEGKPSTAKKIKYLLANLVVSRVASHASGVRLLYPQQLQNYKYHINPSTPTYVFHEFTQVETIQPSKTDKGYILFLGSPLHIKGIDVLIKAFKITVAQYPLATLKIVAWLPGQDEAQAIALAQGIKNLEICKPVPHNQALQLISECTFFVLPSRTEAMGRVLLESMAHQKAIIASAVDGIPHYIKDNFNGLLFESENINALAEKMLQLLTDSTLRNRLAENGRQHVIAHLSESEYFRKTKHMIDTVINTTKL